MMAGCPHSQETQATAASCGLALSGHFPFQEKQSLKMFWESFLIVAVKPWCVIGGHVWVWNSLGFETAQLLLLICPRLLCMDCPQDPWWIFHSGVFKRKVCHSSSRSSSITAAVRVVRGKRWNQLFSFFLSSPSPPHVFLEVNQLGNAVVSVSGMILAHGGRSMLLADSSEVGLVSLSRGWVRGKQSFNYLLGTWRIL